MKKTTNLEIILKSGVPAQVTIIREQGYRTTSFDLDGISGETKDYIDNACIIATIEKAGVKEEYAYIEDGAILSTTRKVGKKTQVVKAMLTEEVAATITSLTKEILAPEEKAQYDQAWKAACEADKAYEQHRRMMSEAMGY